MAGAGLAYVTVFNPDGTLVGRLISQGLLNAPWGLAIAPAGFGSFGGTPLALDGLWAIMFGNGGNGYWLTGAATHTNLESLPEPAIGRLGSCHNP